MFLDWIAQLQLLQHDPQTNILGQLPLAIRRTLISEITAYLCPQHGKPSPDPAIFSSPAHVKWFMEVIGQGFALPLEDLNITMDDVSIYAQWLFEPQARPAAVVSGGLEQEFYQIIFHQYSLLFQPRVRQRPNSVLMSSLNPQSTASPTPPAINTATLKDSPVQLAHRHIELCKNTLNVLAMAGRTLEMTRETWTVLLKVILGISDCLLKEPMREKSKTSIPSMGDELSDHLLLVLTELWLRSQTQQVDMWAVLEHCYRRWTHRPNVIQHWSDTSLSLTKRLLNILYGQNEGADTLELKYNTIVIKLDLPSEFIHYAWYRIIYLIPDTLSLASQNFTLAMYGIGQIVDAFSRVGHYSSEVPDGNTLLHMFGTQLFDACAATPQADLEAQRGCAQAFGTLCKIFCRERQPRPFLRTYIERFYAALTIGLKSDACLPIILLRCTKLFATNLEGVRMLVPDFVAAIKMVLPKLQIDIKDSVAVDDLRLAAIKVISTIMCLPNHFDKVSLKPGWDWEMQCASNSAGALNEQDQFVSQLIRLLYADQSQETIERPFTAIKFYILELLLMSLRTETSSYNMRYLLHLINVYVVEDVPFCQGLVGTVMKLIQEKILTMQLPSDVTLVAFDVLMDFVDLYDYVKRDSKSVARELVLALSRYVDNLINSGQLAHAYPLIVQAYDCMVKWILASQWIVDDRDCYTAVIATLSKGIAIFERDTDAAGQTDGSFEKKKRRDTTFPPTKQLFQLPPRVNKVAAHPVTENQPQPSSRHNSMIHKKEAVAVRMAAEYCMSQFVNQLGRFPRWNEADRKSPAMDDLQHLKYCRESGLIDKEPRYFLVDKRMILAIFDVSDPENVPAVIAVLRDTTGKYTWHMRLQYHNPSKPATPQGASPESDAASVLLSPGSDRKFLPKQVPVVKAVNEDSIPSIKRLYEPGSKEWVQWECFKVLAEKERQAEAAIAAQQKKGPLEIHNVLPSKANHDEESALGFRLLLSELGLLLPENRKRITPLRVTDSFISELEMLDMLSERDCISVTAYFARSGHTKWDELVEYPPPLSQEFLQFLNCMGWPVDIEQHTGFKGKLDATICKKTPYYADRTTEFLVNVPYFLIQPPAGDGAWGNTTSISKIHKQVSSDDHVCVVWIEDLTAYTKLAKRIKMANASLSKAMVYIFINPLKTSAEGLFWIRILIPLDGKHGVSEMASQRLNENALIFGPLVDGIVVSRHALGSMVRNTCISAHQACRVVTETYTKPFVARKQYIEEMAHRHRAKSTLSEFYSEIFMTKGCA